MRKRNLTCDGKNETKEYVMASFIRKALDSISFYNQYITIGAQTVLPSVFTKINCEETDYE